MAKIPVKLDPVLDAAALAAAFDDIAARGSATSPESRMQALTLLKTQLKDARSRAEVLLTEDGSGKACARRLSDMMDGVVRVVHDFACRHVFPASNMSDGERLAIIAVGGYGRGTLAPGSDIDLLFLLPYKQTPWGEQVAEYLLYTFWDLGLKVGYATRNVEESIRQAIDDITIRTALLECRFLCGERALFDQLVQRFDREVVQDRGAEFTRLKLEERDLRHRKHGESRYVVEPNVKDGKGGLRDLHTLFWIGQYQYRVRKASELVGKGVFTRREYRQFEKADDFLWAVRCHLHFLAGKPEERLHFEMQREIAERLGYMDRPGLSAVERFMKHYFLTAKTVGDLTRIFCAALEEEQVKQAPGLENIDAILPPSRRKIPGTSAFVIDNHRINIANEHVFERDPVNMLRLFWFADQQGVEYHPDALKLVTRSLDLINRDMRRDPQANALFMDILTSPRDPELNMRRMNEAGVLGKLIPEFNKIVAMMQFSMYHHYTVDEHLIRCVGVLSELEHGDSLKIHPLSHSLMPGLSRWRKALYTAVLFHDIAKGRKEDHSVAGARIARRLCPHMGFDAVETETIAWLIEQHLTMSMVAQMRDLHDRKTIQDFADVVQSLDRLQMLLVLTVCDIRGVGPGVWNGWKGQLLRTLYSETEILLTGGFSGISQTARAGEARLVQKDALTARNWPEDAIQRYLTLHHSAYLLATDGETQLRHAEFILKADAQGRRVSVEAAPREFEAVTEITVLAPDQPRLLSLIASACAAADANIVDAQIFTTTDGRALDTIMVSRKFELDSDELRRAERIRRLIETALLGGIASPEEVERRNKTRRNTRAFQIEPRVIIRNTLSNRFSVIDIECLDRAGLLAEITRVLADLSLDIASAHISTFGEKVVDTFYVSDLTGAKIEDEARLQAIQEAIMAVLPASRMNGTGSPGK